MSRRQRSAKKKAVRARVAWVKVLRRRLRGSGATRAATAATAAALTLTGVGTSATVAGSTEGAETVGEAAGSASTSLAQCPIPPTTPSSAPDDFVNVGGTLFFTADDGIRGRELWKSDGTRAG